MTHSATSGDPTRTPQTADAGEPPSDPGRPHPRPKGRAVRLLLFAAAREAAGTRRVELEASTVGDLLEQARARFGPAFAAVLDRSRVWVNGEPSDLHTPLTDGDEVAVLPPVSGGQR